MSKRLFLRVAAVVITVVLTACATAPKPADIVDTAARSPELSTLNTLLQQSGLAETLRGTGPYTLLAPTDDAFKSVPADTLAKLKTDKALLRSVLEYHVLPGKLTSAEVKNSTAKTLQGGSVALAKAGTFVTVEDAVVQTPDLAATNGVVHLIDRVLTPPKK